jgi:hypothetical protein
MTGLLIAAELGPSPTVELIATLLSDWRFLAAAVTLDSVVAFAVCRWAWRAWRTWRAWRERRHAARRPDRDP